MWLTNALPSLALFFTVSVCFADPIIPPIDPVPTDDGESLTIPATTEGDGYYTAPAAYGTGALVVVNNGDFQIADNAVALSILDFYTFWTGGENGGPQAPAGEAGGNAGFLTVTNNGDVIFTNVSTAEAMSFGLRAVMEGGIGGMPEHNQSQAFSGGDASAGITVNNTGAFTINGVTGAFTGGGAAIKVLASGGKGGDIDEAQTSVGSGGNSTTDGSYDAVSMNNYGEIFIGSESSPLTYGTIFSGIWAQAQGGPTGQSIDSNVYAAGGYSVSGGSGGSVSVLHTSQIVMNLQVEEFAPASNGYGIQAVSLGQPGVPPYMGFESGSPGGSASTVAVTLQENSSISLTQTDVSSSAPLTNGGAGIFAVSLGGDGGGVVLGEDHIEGATAGMGGDADQVTVTLESGAMVSVTGDNLAGVQGRSVGGNAGGPTGSDNDAGDGGASGLVTIDIHAGAAVTTHGLQSPVVVAQSFSGLGSSGTALGTSGQIGTSFVDELEIVLIAINVNNSGDLIATGADSIGILAQAIPGGGAAQTGNFLSQGGGENGAIGYVYVSHSGTITTGPVGADAIPEDGDLNLPGIASHGILVQSVAGGGGALGAGTTSLTTLGGNTDTNAAVANAGSVVITSSGDISTRGHTSHGILAQSVGGGGGDGGSSLSMLIGVGSSGGQGGAGGNVLTEVTGGTINTLGIVSHSLVAQSIGGGGGNAGGDKVISFGIPTAISIGGSGGNGGSGGEVSAELDLTTFRAEGSNSSGIVLQSIGGGGGTGGGSSTYDHAHGFASSLSLGGSGGSGGHGNTVDAGLSAVTVQTGFTSTLTTAPNSFENPEAWFSNQNPTDAHGVVLQSIGGGGGKGGSAAAKAAAKVVPTGEGFNAAASISFGLGGSGGDGGDSVNRTDSDDNFVPAAGLLMTDGTSVTALGQGSHGVVVQSIGGGGGVGGDSSATSTTFGRADDVDDTPTIELKVTAALGGSGGSGGSGGTVEAGIGGDANGPMGAPVNVNTYGDFASAVLLQSIGGGGGNGGTGAGSTTGKSFATDLEVTLSLGGSGGDGGNGGEVMGVLQAGSSITTYGGGSAGLVAQSIGSGGGQSLGGSFSIGAGTSVTNNSGDGPLDGEFSNLKLKVTTTIGATVAEGGNGGVVQVGTYGSISTHGNDSMGVIAQSIGGGGGIGGSSSSDASADNPVSILTGERLGQTTTTMTQAPEDTDLSVTLGAGWVTGGIGYWINAELSDTITTRGDWSAGLLAQSIGGGGGKGATAIQNGIDYTPNVTLNLTNMVDTTPSDHQYSGNGDAVTIWLNNSFITTGGVNSSGQNTGYSAYGILAQSIGGGGGLAMDGSNQAQGDINVGIGAAGNDNGYFGGGMGVGGEVSLVLVSDSANQITTTGDMAHGIILQSIGGGGGLGATGSSSMPAGDAPPSSGMNIYVGGGIASLGAGENVSFSGDGALEISTTGAGAVGLIAQSVGGGGGIAYAQQQGGTVRLGGSYFSDSFGTEYVQDSFGGNVSVALNSATTITTTGLGAHGVIAQSVGGGGGIANFINASGGEIYLVYDGTNPNETNGFGGEIEVTADGVISTTGEMAHGIIAQSIAAGGGIFAQGGNLYMGATGTKTYNEFTDNAGSVTVTQSGTLSTTGNNSVGIFAQSMGTTGDGGQIEVTVNGTVTGGAGNQGYGVWIDAGQSGDSENPGNYLTIGESGLVTALSGTAIISSGNGNLQINNSGAIHGSIIVDSNGQILNSNIGLIRAGETIHAELVIDQGVTVVAGNLANSVGTTTISGVYQQDASATMEMTILGAEAGEFAFLSIENTATLGGHLNIWFSESYFPPLGETWTLISVEQTFDEYIFDFSTVSVFNLASGYQTSYWASGDESNTYFNLQITAIPEPGTAGMLLLAGFVLWAARRRQGCQSGQL